MFSQRLRNDAKNSLNCAKPVSNTALKRYIKLYLLSEVNKRGIHLAEILQPKFCWEGRYTTQSFDMPTFSAILRTFVRLQKRYLRFLGGYYFQSMCARLIKNRNVTRLKFSLNQLLRIFSWTILKIAIERETLLCTVFQFSLFSIYSLILMLFHF